MVGPVTINDASVNYTGTGQPEVCLSILNHHVYSVPEEQCHPKPCSVGSVYQPTIQNEQFFAVSAFIYPLRTLGLLDTDDWTFSPAETEAAALSFCKRVRWEVESRRAKGKDIQHT